MIIFRYLSRSLYVTLLALTAVIIAIFIINQFVLLIEAAARGQLSMVAVARLMCVMLPLMVCYLLPLGLYLSIILVLGRWCVDQEMVVLRACGMSTRELLGKVLLFSSCVAIVVGLLALYVNPTIERLKATLKNDIAQQSAVSYLLPQSFTSLDSGNTVYAEKISHNHKVLSNVFLAELDANGQWRVTSAKQASEKMISAWGQRYFELQSGSQLSVGDNTNDVHAVGFDHYGIRMDMATRSTNRWPKDAPTSTLWSQYTTNPKVAAEVQWRVGLPVSVILLAMLAVPLSDLRPRQGQFGRLFPAILIYLVYANCFWFGKTLVANASSPAMIGLWWVQIALAVCVIAAYLHSSGWSRCCSVTRRWVRRIA